MVICSNEYIFGDLNERISEWVEKKMICCYVWTMLNDRACQLGSMPIVHYLV